MFALIGKLMVGAAFSDRISHFTLSCLLNWIQVQSGIDSHGKPAHSSAESSEGLQQQHQHIARLEEELRAVRASVHALSRYFLQGLHDSCAPSPLPAAIPLSPLIAYLPFFLAFA